MNSITNALTTQPDREATIDTILLDRQPWPDDAAQRATYARRLTDRLESEGWRTHEIDQLYAEADAQENATAKRQEKVAKGYPTTDAGNADRLIQRHGSDIRYVFEQKTWLAWDGKCWARDVNGRIEQYALDTARSIDAEVSQAESTDDRTRLRKWATQSESASRLEAMVKLSRSNKRVVVRASDLDSDTWALNAENGTVDLRTGALGPHDPKAMHSKITRASLQPQASAVSWESFLAEVLPDEDVRRFVQKLAGYSLTGEVGEHVLPFAYGPGSNGKSVFFSVLRKVLGDYATEAAPDLLVARHHDRGISNDVRDLRGFRFVTTTEIENGKRMDTTLMKRITGEDTIKARLLYSNLEEYRNVTHLWMAANDRPQVDGLDEAIWRRVRLIPFEVVIPEARRNPNLIAELLRERDGILGWLVNGCVAYAQEGLEAPSAVKLATAEYRSDSNPLLDWFQERCVVENATETPSDLHANYKDWCSRSRYRGKPIAANSPRWRAGLESLGLEPDKEYVGPKQVRVWRGVRLAGESASHGLPL